MKGSGAVWTVDCVPGIYPPQVQCSPPAAEGRRRKRDAGSPTVNQKTDCIEGHTDRGLDLLKFVWMLHRHQVQMARTAAVMPEVGCQSLEARLRALSRKETDSESLEERFRALRGLSKVKPTAEELTRQEEDLAQRLRLLRGLSATPLTERELEQQETDLSRRTGSQRRAGGPCVRQRFGA